MSLNIFLKSQFLLKLWIKEMFKKITCQRRQLPHAVSGQKLKLQ
jgi:hypothetical protein